MSWGGLELLTLCNKPPCGTTTLLSLRRLFF